MTPTGRWFLLAVPFLLARPAAAAVFINEFERHGPTHQIELYNSGPSAQDLTGWKIRNSSGGELLLSGVLPAEGFTAPGQANIVPESGQIELLDGTLFQQDEVLFGDQGGAPLPPPILGFSCARVSNGLDTGDFAANWTLDRTSTLGASNDGQAPSLGGDPIVMSEIGRTSALEPGRSLACPVSPQVELYNRCLFDIVVNGWYMTDGRDTMSLAGTVPVDSFLVISGFPAEFCFEQTRVIYLFDHLGRRVDQWGVRGSTISNSTQSWQRVPAGAGPFDGFSYATSGGDSSMAVLPETFGTPNPPILQNVPTLSEWGLILLSLLVVTTGTVALRQPRVSGGRALSFLSWQWPLHRAELTRAFALVGCAALLLHFISALRSGPPAAPDVVGTLACLPVLAYLVHVLRR
jgi:hypothetical protein